MANPFVFLRGQDGLSPEQRKLLEEPLRIPPGFGMVVLDARAQEKAWANLDDEICPTETLIVWEPPRRAFRYVVSVDVSRGLELDYSVVDVLRVGTVREPDEQVAQFRTQIIDETDLAYYVDAIGRLYKGKDDLPALVAVEGNAMGTATINELDKHIGYPNQYIWHFWGNVDGKDLSRQYGWYTTQRSRPIMLQTYVHAVKTVDPHTGWPDYRVNSPVTMSEWAMFHSPGPLYMAEAADGFNDDCIMAGAIGVIVAKQMFSELGETAHDHRRRLSEEASRVAAREDLLEQHIAPQNTDASADQIWDQSAWDEENTDHMMADSFVRY